MSALSATKLSKPTKAFALLALAFTLAFTVQVGIVDTNTKTLAWLDVHNAQAAERAEARSK